MQAFLFGYSIIHVRTVILHAHWFVKYTVHGPYKALISMKVGWCHGTHIVIALKGIKNFFSHDTKFIGISLSEFYQQPHSGILMDA